MRKGNVVGYFTAPGKSFSLDFLNRCHGHSSAWGCDFRLDPDSGKLSMNGRVREGVYNFKVKVFDKVWNREVVSTVSVTVQEIGDEPVINSGSLRLSGMLKTWGPFH